MPALKRLRKNQESAVGREATPKQLFLLTRVLEEVAAPLDESASLCQQLLNGSGGKLSLEQRALVGQISGGTAQSVQRLRDYVDLMFLETGDLSLRTKAHALDEDIDRAVRECRPAARAKGLNLVVEPAVGPLSPVQADPARVVQVLTNLIANAVKFTDRGQIIVSTEPYDRSIAVHVVDTGIGIPAEQLPKLFEDFYQGEDAKARDPLAAGLGLTLSRRLVVRLGGDLWVSSTVGAGSKFSFTVPRAPNPAGQSRLSPV